MSGGKRTAGRTVQRSSSRQRGQPSRSAHDVPLPHIRPQKEGHSCFSPAVFKSATLPAFNCLTKSFTSGFTSTVAGGSRRAEMMYRTVICAGQRQQDCTSERTCGRGAVRAEAERAAHPHCCEDAKAAVHRRPLALVEGELSAEEVLDAWCERKSRRGDETVKRASDVAEEAWTWPGREWRP